MATRRASSGEPCWAGVDVGGRRKNFHAAVISRGALLEGPVHLNTRGEALAWLERHAPRVVAVDSPRCWAAAPKCPRRAEEEFIGRRICGIRLTPDEQAGRSHRSGYYEWIRNGLELYAELDTAALASGWEVVECFPTASFTRLGGPRGSRSRAAWSRDVLAESGLSAVPARMSQDGRDAVMAAITARADDDRLTERFGGELVVPAPPATASACGPSGRARPTTRTSRRRA